MPDEDDGIPLLDDIVHTSGGNGPRSEGAGLSDTEIEAIAARVVERHAQQMVRDMEQAVARAIRTALNVKARGSEHSKDDADGQAG